MRYPGNVYYHLDIFASSEKTIGVRKITIAMLKGAMAVNNGRVLLS
jgi:hypothetical protein